MRQEQEQQHAAQVQQSGDDSQHCTPLETTAVKPAPSSESKQPQPYKSRELPIIALSANVMSDVHDKCVAAGFSDYITKPVDFIDLSRALAKFF